MRKEKQLNFHCNMHSSEKPTAKSTNEEKKYKKIVAIKRIECVIKVQNVGNKKRATHEIHILLSLTTAKKCSLQFDHFKIKRTN